MKINLRFWSLLLLIYSCQPISNSPIDYPSGHQEKRVSQSLAIQLSDYTTYGQLVNQVQSIVCQDSVAKLSFTTGNNIKNIYPVNYCEPIKFDPKARDLIFITNGILSKHQREISIDSLNHIIQKDFTNYGKEAQFASTPERLLIIVEFEKESPVNQLQSVLTKVTAAYDQVNTEHDLKILLYLHKDPPPPPPSYEN